MKRFAWLFAVSSIFALGLSRSASANVAAPTDLAALVQSVKGSPSVHLSWAAAPGAFLYKAYRDGRVLSYTRGLSCDDAHVAAGETHAYAVSAVRLPAIESLRSAPVTVTLPPAPPPAPVGLRAVGSWVVDCPHCAMPMAHIVLSWGAAPRARTYTVYRNGAPLTGGLTSPGYTDMAVTSGETYAYAVDATGAGGAGPLSAVATATAPGPPAATAPAPMPAMTGPTPPTNLAAHGVWQGGPTDVLTWDAVPGASSYTVYQYDQPLAAGITATSYSVPLSRFNASMTYTVTAVNAGGESIPSAIAQAAGALDPAQRPGWMPDAPVTPTALVATPEWNAGGPRVRLAWHGSGTDATYSVYRDGVRVATGLWRLTYLDAAVRPGETHAYAVSGVNIPWTAPVESALSAVVAGGAPAGPPAPSAVPVQITRVVPDDDSAVVFFQAVPGAADYRVYDAAKPGTVKYSGGGLSVEMNGLDPVAGADLVVEAVDKLGPFQKMDGAAGPGAMAMGGMAASSINGQGDPSNVPLVLAASAPFHVTCRPAVLAGAQGFLDDFRGSLPLTPSALDPAIAALPDSYSEITEVENDKWRVRTYGADTAMSRSFLMGGHFMDTLYDGPTAATHPFSHNNNASLVMMPKATADISGGRVLHVTFEVDGHFDGRRWCDVFVAQAGDRLLVPSKFSENNELPTVSGNLFRWEIHGNIHDGQVFLGKDGAGNLRRTELFDEASGVGADDFGPAARVTWDGKPLLNGTTADLDRRHRFDLYLSQTHFRVLETAPGEAPVLVKDETFPNGVALPFTDCQVCFVHQLYHTGNDRPELVNYDPADAYWYDNRPWADERHWDNCGFSVLDAFPSPPSGQ